MRIESLHIGQRVTHPQHGLGTVKSLNEHTAEIRFDDGIQRTVSPATSELQLAEAQAQLTALEMPLAQLVRQTVEATITSLGVERTSGTAQELGNRWRNGRVVFHPADPTLQTKEVEIEVFFHKIVMIRNNLRVLEQKINADERLSATEKFDCQQYITRCYGSLTTFNILFGTKEGQF